MTPDPMNRPSPLWIGLIASVALIAILIAGVHFWPAKTFFEQPYKNSLEMRFAPVPIVGGPSGGTHVLFGIWDTRVQDYDAFLKATGLDPKDVLVGFGQPYLDGIAID